MKSQPNESVSDCGFWVVTGFIGLIGLEAIVVVVSGLAQLIGG